MADLEEIEKKRKRSMAAKGDEYPSLVGDPMGTAKKVGPADSNEVIDLSISRRMDPMPKEIRQQVRQKANKFIREQRVLESHTNKAAIRKEQGELKMRRNFSHKTLHEIMEHRYYARMMKSITEEMIEREKQWKRYKPNKFIRDTETFRRRIQNAVPLHWMEYAIKYSKKPWRYPGKNKIKTKFFDKVDWVDHPYVVLEEKTEKDFKKETVKA